MPTSSKADRRGQAAELLAGYLIACVRFHPPGADGQTVEAVVASEYPAAAAAGWVPQVADLARRHADLAGAIRTFFPIDEVAPVAG